VTAAAADPSQRVRREASHRATFGIALPGSLLLAITACAPPQLRTSPELSSVSGASAAQNPLAACTPAQIAFSLDPGDGRFNGMSHSGTALVLRNFGPVTCTLPTPSLPTFNNANRHVLHITPRYSPHARPASSTITLAPGTAISSDLHWVSGDVYDGGHCVSPTSITLAIGGYTLTADFTGHLCAPHGQSPSVTATPFQFDAASIASLAKTLTYTCNSGRTVQAAYPDPDTAVLILDGQTRSLRLAISADGARYVGKRWQWWTKGMHDAWLAPLQPGETVASARGEACTAP
jgi:membrane-bound inhibitor of C-type lysozyme